jgi:dihydroorotase
MSSGPANAFKLAGGRLAVGTPADIAIFDLNRPWTVEPAKLKSKSKNTPWAGKELKGVAVKTILGGVVVYKRD